jgi:nucleotide-binding universal stress UspA family protein
MFRNILLPIDGSAVALQAAEAVAEMASASPGTHVTAVLVIQPWNAKETDYDDDVVAVQNAKIRERAQAALDAVGRVLAVKNVPFTVKMVEGDPVSIAIAREAQEGAYDLIAMASRGMGMQKNDLHYLGSVAEHVIRRVCVPVLVLPIHKDK